MTADTGKKPKKASGGMNAAVASTEKIRTWVRINPLFINYSILERAHNGY